IGRALNKATTFNVRRRQHPTQSSQRLSRVLRGHTRNEGCRDQDDDERDALCHRSLRLMRDKRWRTVMRRLRKADLRTEQKDYWERLRRFRQRKGHSCEASRL